MNAKVTEWRKRPTHTYRHWCQVVWDISACM